MKYIKDFDTFVNENFSDSNDSGVDELLSYINEKEKEDLEYFDNNHDYMEEPDYYFSEKVENDDELKYKLRKLLKLALEENPDIKVSLADQYEWSDGSNGFINFNELDHWLNWFAEDMYGRDIFDNYSNYISEIKKHGAIPDKNGKWRKGEKYRDHDYDIHNEFSW